MQKSKLIVMSPGYKPKGPVSKDGDWTEIAPSKWCVGDNIIYFGAVSYVLHLTQYVPNFDTGSELFKSVFSSRSSMLLRFY